MTRLEGRRAIVTGAGSGIGRAIARRFAAEGGHVVLGDVDGEAAVAVAAELPGDAVARRADVSSAEDVSGVVTAAVERWGGLDVMVNNAGVGRAAPRRRRRRRTGTSRWRST